MKKLLSLSIILLSLFTGSTSAQIFKFDNCPQENKLNEFININGALGSNINISEEAGYFGADGGDESFDNPVQEDGNASLVGEYGNTICMQKEGFTSLEIGITKLNTSTHGKHKVLNCKIKTGITPQTINLYVTWDAKRQSYICMLF